MAATPKAPAPAVQAKKPAHVPRAGRTIARPAPEISPPIGSAPRAYFLIGENKKIAGDVAEHEWKWMRTKTGWDGPMKGIKFLPDIAAVQKEATKGPGPIAVFEGYRWYATIAPHMLDALVKAGAVIKMPLPEPL